MTIKDRIEVVRTQTADAAERAGRNINDIDLMAVTKNRTQDEIKEAADCGIHLFGENRIQEATAKYSDKPNEWELHFIGHLQSNKAKKAAGLCSCIQSIDSAELAAKINRYLNKEGRILPVTLEINVSGEDSKYGYHDEGVLFRDIDKMLDFPNIRIAGLMTVAPFTDDEHQIRTAFKKLYQLFIKIRDSYQIQDFTILSMGMSNDYPIAIEEGSSLIRIGTALFGPRDV
jgi:hypothetical protein